MKNLLVISLLLLQAAGFSQNLQVNVSKQSVAVGERFTLEYKTENAGASFTPPTMRNARVLSGPNMSESTVNINGRRSRSFTVTYVLSAKTEGECLIGPASLKTKSETFTSDPVSVKVTKAPIKKGRSAGGGTTSSTEKDFSSTLFIKLFIDDKSPYVGEQIVATYKIYMAENVVDYSASAPVYNGFYAQNIDLQNNNDVSREYINNRQFTVATLKKVLLTPQKTGELDVDGLEMELRVRVQDKSRGRGFFGFGSYRDVPVSVVSNKEKIVVKSLPTNEQPTDFDGAVGKFSLSAKVDRNQLKANEAVNLTVTYSGAGNIELIGEPQIDFPKDFEVYDPKVKKNISHSAGGSSGRKSFEYVVIPRFGGEFELAPITLSYFDPQKGKYIQLKSEPIILNVEKGDPSSEASVYNPANKEDVQIIGRDIRFIQTDSSKLARQESYFFKSARYYITLILLFLLGIGAWVFRSFMKKKIQDGNLTSRKAGSIAKKHLAKATKLKSGDNEAFYEAISKALFGYLSDKLSLPLSELNREKIELVLGQKNINTLLISELSKALDECEMVRFAPGIVRGKDEMLASSKEIIEKLENEL